MGTAKDSEQTRARIIDAAGQLFAERGFNGVTVRDIVKQADSHLSAMNYHFKSKDALYREVLLVACQAATLTPEDERYLLNLAPREALYLYINDTLELYRSQNSAKWQNTLITRESWDPSPVFEEVVDHYFQPQTHFLATIVGRVVNKAAEDNQVLFAVMSLFGLLDTYGMYGTVIKAVAPELPEYLEQRNMLKKQLFQTTISMASATVDDSPQ